MSSLPSCRPGPLQIAIAGGGAGGLMAAWRAASLGHRVTLIEANGKLGTKLRISGGGKCNITHEGPMQALLAAFRKEQARFLRPAFHAFGNEDLLALLRQRGIETYVRDNGRVFPLDRPGSAELVVKALVDLVQGAGVEVRTGSRIRNLVGAGPCLEAFQLENGTWIRADVFILATGGASYPETGTRGEVLHWLRQLQVPVAPWFPALAPIPLQRPHPEWEGVAFREGTLVLSAGEGGRRLAHHGGDLVFTKTGISGPAALELSRETEMARRAGSAWLAYAFGNSIEENVEATLLEEQRGHPHLAVRTWLQRHLPERVAESSLGTLGIPPDQRLKDLTKVHRKALARRICAFPLGEPGAVSLARGEVSAGGVCLSAVDPRTMRLKDWTNLRVCGELLDIDGPVGGYNLQAAFSTGYVAGSLS
jgi:predicted Rossmann fold flavoprotein